MLAAQVIHICVQFSSFSRVWLFATPLTATHQASLSITNSVYSDSYPLSQWCHPTISSSVVLLLPSFIFLSIRVFSNESTVCINGPMYWSFHFSIIPSNEYSGLISFRIDWLNLLTVQGALKSLLQHYFLKKSILWHSAFFMVHLSDLYLTTGKTIALTMKTFVSKVMSLLFNMLSRLIIAFLPTRKHLLISCLQSPSAVILEPRKIVCHCFHCFPIYFPWSDGTRCHDPSFLNAEFQANFSLSSFTFIISSSSISAIRVVSSAYLRLLIFFPVILIPSFHLSSLAFCMMWPE